MTSNTPHDRPSATPMLGDRLTELSSRIIGRLKLGPYAQITRFGLCRDLDVPIAMPRAKIPIAVRELQDSDLPSLLSLEAGSAEDIREAAVRRNFISKGARRGFVAVDERSHMPCYVQWLFGVEDNPFILRLGGFPPLEPGQALLENAYTPPNYRGLGIMSVAMALIAERATIVGARSVFTFVGESNIASLKGCQRAGFNPVLLHHSIRVGFGVFRWDRFELLNEADPRRTARF